MHSGRIPYYCRTLCPRQGASPFPDVLACGNMSPENPGQGASAGVRLRGGDSASEGRDFLLGNYPTFRSQRRRKMTWGRPRHAHADSPGIVSTESLALNPICDSHQPAHTQRVLSDRSQLLGSNHCSALPLARGSNRTTNRRTPLSSFDAALVLSLHSEINGVLKQKS